MTKHRTIKIVLGRDRRVRTVIRPGESVMQVGLPADLQKLDDEQLDRALAELPSRYRLDVCSSGPTLYSVADRV